MSTTRQGNWLGQQRLDVPQLRALESSIANDFDVGCSALTGNKPYAIYGLKIAETAGTSITSLHLDASNSLIFHGTASEHGTLFRSGDLSLDSLSTNGRVKGGFVLNAVNYVGLDLRRVTGSPDRVAFWDVDAKAEVLRTVPTARLLDYVIVIGTRDFVSQPNLLPVAIVTVDGAGIATQIQDARQLLFSLQAGGNTPNASSYYTFPGGRSNGSTSAFTGGDKDFRSLKQWMDATSTRVWELGGGTSWMSANVRDTVKLICGPTVLGNGDNFDWSGTPTLQWSGLSLVFANVTGAHVIPINDGSAVLADGQCLVVDLDPALASLTPLVVQAEMLGQPTLPGSRHVLVWRIGADIFVRDRPHEEGRILPLATDSTYGVVKLKYADATPTVLTVNANGGLTNSVAVGAAFDATGTGGADGVRATSTGGGAAVRILSSFLQFDNGGPALANVGDAVLTFPINDTFGDAAGWRMQRTSENEFFLNMWFPSGLDGGGLHSNSATNKTWLTAPTASGTPRITITAGGAIELDQWQVLTTGELSKSGPAAQIKNVQNPTALQDAATKNYVDALDGNYRNFNARLSVATSSALADGQGNTLYLRPFHGNDVFLPDGTRRQAFGISLSAAGLTIGTVYQLFLWDDSGTLRLYPTADTFATATGGTPFTATYYRNTTDYSGSSGPGTGNGLYVGCVKVGDIGAGVSGFIDTVTNRAVWNYFNRVERPFYLNLATYAASTSFGVWQQFGGSAAASQIQFCPSPIANLTTIKAMLELDFLATSAVISAAGGISLNGAAPVMSHSEAGFNSSQRPGARFHCNYIRRLATSTSYLEVQFQLNSGSDNFGSASSHLSGTIEA